MKSLKIPEEYKYISAFLTFRCNLNCSFCLNKFDKSFEMEREEISGEKWVRGLNRIISRTEVPITFSGGEPTLHSDFFYILNNLKPELKADLLTNLQWSRDTIKKFIKEISPEKFKGNSKYPSIRVSYHPEQMGDGGQLIKRAKMLQNAGFNVGIYGVQYPSPKQLEALTQMQFRCRDDNIDFRIKDFTGVYSGEDDDGNSFSITYGNYSKYQSSAFQKNTRECECRTSELLIGPNGDVYRCHRDAFAESGPIGNINNHQFDLEYKFRRCNTYGRCHPCDVKVKTNYKQQLEHTSVEIINLKN